MFLIIYMQLLKIWYHHLPLKEYYTFRVKLKSTLESLVPSIDPTHNLILGKNWGAAKSMGLGQSSGYPSADILGVSALVIKKILPS